MLFLYLIDSVHCELTERTLAVQKFSIGDFNG